MMMRRGIGAGAIAMKKTTEAKFNEAGTELKEATTKTMVEQLSAFKNNLEEFAKKHRKQISKDPVFRSQFNDMCTKIGVDPLSSQKSFWSELLGVNDFYYELGVQIIEACLATRASNGGLIPLDALYERIKMKRGAKAQAISLDDIERSIKRLKELGNGFGIIMVGSKKMVQSVPREMNNDHTTVLLLAQDTGYILPKQLKDKLSWDQERVDSVMGHLLHEGVSWLDAQHAEGVAYWFPSLAPAASL
eukprot:TRINITY_DN12671_c0_g1_i1.p1 TRINITY_DN12671_c0_g1~~TRINITY_DN12671_c0_g1_i1.p1  ORF type:complete len:255 (-),score=66.39 TRINITY_DN12671_c0_g1_i1:188-928(-)